MTKGVILFGLGAGATLGLFVPRLFGETSLGIANLFTAIMGAILGLIGVAVVIHYYGRIQ